MGTLTCILTHQASIQGLALSCVPVLCLDQDLDLAQAWEMEQSRLLHTANPPTSGTSSTISLQQHVQICLKRIRPSSPENPAIGHVLILPVDGERNGASSPAHQMPLYNVASLNDSSGGEQQVRDSTCAHTQQIVVWVQMLFVARQRDAAGYVCVRHPPSSNVWLFKSWEHVWMWWWDLLCLTSTLRRISGYW